MKQYYSQITFFIIISVLIAVSFLTYRNLSNYINEVKWIRHSNRILKTLEMTLSSLTDAETGHRGYQLTRDTTFLDPYYAATEAIPPLIKTLDSLVSGDFAQAKKVDSLKNLSRYQFLLISRIIANANRSGLYMDTYEKKLLMREKNNMAAIRSLIIDLRHTENEILIANTKRESGFQTIAPVAILVYTLIAIGGAIVLFYRILEALRRREQAESELAESNLALKNEVVVREFTQTLLQNVLNNSTNGIMAFKSIRNSQNEIIDFEGILANAASLKIADKNEKEIVGRSLLEVFPSIKEQGLFDFYKETVATGGPMSMETYTREGLNKYFYISAVKLGDGFVATYSDITELKLKEKELEQNNIHLTRSNEDLEQFGYVASHDLQEPLRKIRAFGDLLFLKYADRIDETGADYINRMQGAASRMQTLIQDLLPFSKITRNLLNYQVIDTKSLIGEVLDDLENQIQRESATITIGKLPSLIKGDKTQLKRLFQNLVSNAIKFHKPDKKPVIQIDSNPLTIEDQLLYFSAAQPDTKYIMFTIEDNGIGFDQQYTEKIFSIFQRLNGRMDYEGTGIGLAICRKIVTNHNGVITAKSKEDHGSQFIVILPSI